MERRRAWLRLSLCLNVVLLAVPLYLFTIRGLDLDAALSQYVTEHRAASALGRFADYDFDDGSDHATNLKHGEAGKHGAAVPQEVIAEKEPTPPPPPPPPPPPAPKARSCHICDAGETGKEFCKKWGRDSLTRGIAYSGTNHRLRRALAKMRRGEPWTMGVLGGSVSTGHGLRDPTGEVLSEFNMHRFLFDHLNATFPSAKGSILHNVQKMGEAPLNDGHNMMVNGAVPARGSDYFAYCSHLHVPEDADLVVLENAINDPLHIHMVETFELLLRSMLERDHTAVLVFNVFAFKFDNIAMGGDLNGGTTSYYDTPVLSSRNAMLPYMFSHPDTVSDWFATMDHRLEKDKQTLDNVDIRHFGRPLHKISGEMMVAYIDSQLCEMDALEEAEGTKDMDKLYPLDPIPPQRLMDKYAHGTHAPKLTPFCASTSSERHPLSPVENNGWYEWSSSPEKKYLVSKTPGSTVKFKFTTTQGKLVLYYLSSRDFGLGNVKCWVDNHENDHLSIVLKGYWTNPFNTGATKMIVNIPSGEHMLTCRLLEQTDDPKGGQEFRFMSIMSI